MDTLHTVYWFCRIDFMGVDLVGVDFVRVDVEAEHQYVGWESANTAKLIVSLFRVSLDHESNLTINEYPCQIKLQFGLKYIVTIV